MNNQRLMELAGVRGKQLNEQQYPSLEQATEYLARALVPYAQRTYPEADPSTIQEEIDLAKQGDFEDGPKELFELISDSEGNSNDVATKAIVQALNHVLQQN